MKAKTSDASMLPVESSSISNDTRQPQKSQKLTEQLQLYRALQKIFLNLNEIVESVSSKETTELSALKQAFELNSFQAHALLKSFETSNSNTRVVDIQIEQKKDPVLRKVMAWIQEDAQIIYYICFI